jgi:hypothetical protein
MMVVETDPTRPAEGTAPMRTLLASWLLLCGVVSAHAENHIYLSCSQGHTATKTTFEDGHVQTEREKAASTFPIDVDLDHKTINGVYDAPHGQQLEYASVGIGGHASKLASEHEPGYLDTISIDRFSGRATVRHAYFPPEDCVARLGNAASCRTSETTTVYRCMPAMTDFPTPIPKMTRAWERLRHSVRLARLKRTLWRWYTSMERRILPSEIEQ